MKSITIKPDKSPVTDGDLAVDEILSSKINELTPNIPIISEETSDIGCSAKSELAEITSCLPEILKSLVLCMFKILPEVHSTYIVVRIKHESVKI